MTLRVTLIQGGGMGSIRIPAVRLVVKAGVAIAWDEHLAGQASLERGGGNVLPTRCGLRETRTRTRASS